MNKVTVVRYVYKEAVSVNIEAPPRTVLRNEQWSMSSVTVQVDIMQYVVLCSGGVRSYQADVL